MDNICYRISYQFLPKTNGNGRNMNKNHTKHLSYDKYNVVFSPDHSSGIFSIQFSNMLNATKRFRVIMHPTNNYPWIEAAYTSEIYRHIDDGKFDRDERFDRKVSRRNNLYSVTSPNVEVNKLPPPYTSNCRNYSAERLKGVFQCRQKCFRKNAQDGIGIVPFNSRIWDPIDFRRLCAKDTKNETIGIKLAMYEK